MARDLFLFFQPDSNSLHEVVGRHVHDRHYHFIASFDYGQIFGHDRVAYERPVDASMFNEHFRRGFCGRWKWKIEEHYAFSPVEACGFAACDDGRKPCDVVGSWEKVLFHDDDFFEGFILYCYLVFAQGVHLFSSIW
jgi:hypothetical protein